MDDALLLALAPNPSLISVHSVRLRCGIYLRPTNKGSDFIFSHLSLPTLLLFDTPVLQGIAIVTTSGIYATYFDRKPTIPSSFHWNRYINSISQATCSLIRYVSFPGSLNLSGIT